MSSDRLDFEEYVLIWAERKSIGNGTYIIIVIVHACNGVRNVASISCIDHELPRAL